MWKSLKKKYLFSNDRKVLASNFLSLSIIQSLKYLLPFITIPYLVRILGPSNFGIFSFAQAIIQYFLIITDYGFSLYAIKEISISKDNPKKVSEIFCSIMLIKTLIMIAMFSVLCILVSVIPKFRSDQLLYIFSFGIVVGNVLFPIWFFQGMEKMKYITFVDIIAKSIFTISIFLLIKKGSDYSLAALLNSMGFISAGIVSLYIALKKFDITILMPSWKSITECLSKSFYFFLSRISLSIVTATNTVVLGIFTNNAITGYYAAADKIVQAVEALTQPLVMAIYPYISRTRNKRFFKRVFYCSTILGMLLFIVFFLYNKPIIFLLLGNQYEPTANVMKIFSFVFPISFTSILLGLPFLAAMGHTKYFNMSVVIGSIAHIIGLMCVIPIINIYSVTIVAILTKTFILSIRIYGIKKLSLWKSDD